MPSAPPIGFECKPSWLLLACTVAMLALALLAVALSAGPVWLHRLLWFWLLGYGAWGVIWLLRPRVRSLLWHGDGGADIDLRPRALDDGGQVHGEVVGARCLGPLVTLRLRWTGHGRASLWLLPDNLDADTLRRLRVRIRATDFSVRRPM